MDSFIQFCIVLPFVEPGVRWDTCMWADHVVDCATAGCCHHTSALTIELLATLHTYALSLTQQLLVFCDYLSEIFKNGSDATISSQD